MVEYYLLMNFSARETERYYYFGGVKLMTTLEIVLGIIIMVMSAAVVALVLFQSGKDKRLSGAIAGAAETFFAKGKSQKRDKVLSTITTVMSFVLVILAVVLYIYLAL